MILPRITSLEEYRAVYARDEPWLPAIEAIAARHGLTGPAVRQPLGTHVVFGFGPALVKLYAPLWPQDFQAEQVALSHLPDLPVPHILAAGEVEGWPYLVLTRVQGVPAVEVWPGLPLADKLAVMGQLGRFLRALHQHALPPGLARDWPAFLEARLSSAAAHHQAGEPWRGWIQARLDRFHEPPLPPVLLHADLTADHVLLVEQDGAWAMSAVIDLGDARAGHPFYEFIAPLAELTFGQPALSLALVRAYGLEPTPALCDVLTTYCLLHQFGRLGDFLDAHPVDGPDEFQAALWGAGMIERPAARGPATG